MDEISDLAVALSCKGQLDRLNKKDQPSQSLVCPGHFSAECGFHIPLCLLTLTEGFGLREHSLEYLPLCIWLDFTVVVPAGRG